MAKLLYHKKITSDNREFGGVHPAKAVIGHSQTLGSAVQDAVRNGLHGEIPDFITVTRGPGMNQNLAVGLNTAKGLAAAWNIPLLGVNHMQAHALTPRLITALDRYLPGSSHAYLTGQQNGVQDVGNPSWAEAEEGLMLRDGCKLTFSKARNKACVDELPKEPSFPYLSLLVSGGHTMLVISESVITHRILVPNLSGLALGDMLDKAARVLVPQDILDQSPDTNYAAILESFAFPNNGDVGYGYEPPATRADEIAPLPVEVQGQGVITTLTPPLAGTRRLAYDFAGLGTQVKQKLQEVVLGYEIMPKSAKPDSSPEATEKSINQMLDARRALARATMRLAFEHLASRILFVLSGDENLHPDTRAILPNVETLVVSGGVARNKYLNRILRSTLDARGHGNIAIATPPPPFCTDNAAMIAWCGAEMWEEGWRSEMDVLPLKKWPIDPAEEGGILGAAGWVPRDGMEKEL
jgi:N6-L-threonylcarbamoyladenine synthase